MLSPRSVSQRRRAKPTSAADHPFVPGEHWEIEVFAEGHVEIERFFADPEGVLDDESLLDELIAQNQN